MCNVGLQPPLQLVFHRAHPLATYSTFESPIYKLAGGVQLAWSRLPAETRAPTYPAPKSAVSRSCPHRVRHSWHIDCIHRVAAYGVWVHGHEGGVDKRASEVEGMLVEESNSESLLPPPLARQSRKAPRRRWRRLGRRQDIASRGDRWSVPRRRLLLRRLPYYQVCFCYI